MKDQYVQITGNPNLPWEAVCDNDGVCDSSENSETCSGDCPSSGADCGNGMCEAGDG